MKFRQPVSGAATERTIIGQSAVVVGNIVSQELVQLKGHVVGNIDVNGSPNAQLSVLSQAHVEGDISAQQAVVNGVVTGNIESTGRVELHAGADVKGNISYATMAIEHGAKLYGMMSNTDVKQH
ncbi:polymer-forming cytoskeletal protein [Limnohabitans sp. INBF002]|uniref:bactofilin family protein n=1 Tax=Limnohabitans sp. INBF002 TaxID=2986280 RepID=UPI002493859C|nr:polymer-forming cytoskeletal protein [Limnohabitans sp. INBF002]